MIIVEQRPELINAMSQEGMMKHIEEIGRVCYKSEDKITENSAEKFIKNIIKNGHEAVLEHGNITIKFICDRGISHELVRHRVAAYCQESTRYCNYSKDKFGGEITFIKPISIDKNSYSYEIWLDAMDAAEDRYFNLLEYTSPQIARSVLPNSLKTEIVATMNIRQWRHVLKQRTSKAAHPDMRDLMIKTLNMLKEFYPIFFEDVDVDE